MARLGSLLEQRARERFVGREAELEAIAALLQPDGPVVVHVSGPGGIGKSRMLDAFVPRAREAGAVVVRLDCRMIEPSVPGFLGAAASATGASAATLEALVERIGALGDRVLLVLDTYERFWLMDTYIRRDLCPALPDSTRILLASRERPATAWISSPEWHGLFRSVALGPLTERDSLAYLKELGVETETARRIAGVAHGHPLALTMAAELSHAGGSRKPEDIASGAVVDVLARAYLAEVADPVVREALEASSVVRRTTGPLLCAMLPESSPADLLERMRDVPGVETAADGLFIHDTIRDAVATGLKASDPARYTRYRIAAWRVLRSELSRATAANLWRYTADILFLLQNPVVREGFFPTGYQPLSVEPASAADGDAIRHIASLHTGPQEQHAIATWWSQKPRSFRVARDIEGATRGFVVIAKGAEIDGEIISADPLAAAWSADIKANGAGSSSLGIRFLLDDEEGERISASKGVFGLDVKRTYMEMRPNLRYIYVTGREPENLDWCDPLGFQPLPSATVKLDEAEYPTRRLDMGPGSVEGWLSRVVADELGIPAEDRSPGVFDLDGRQLIIDDNRVPLTPLEFGLLALLHRRGGRPVSRADIIEEVWGYDANGTSNVVEAVVLALRRKLGRHATLVETVRSVGYRYNQGA